MYSNPSDKDSKGSNTAINLAKEAVKVLSQVSLSRRHGNQTYHFPLPS